jgi:hypothetical protein
VEDGSLDSDKGKLGGSLDSDGTADGTYEGSLFFDGKAHRKVGGLLNFDGTYDGLDDS